MIYYLIAILLIIVLIYWSLGESLVISKYILAKDLPVGTEALCPYNLSVAKSEGKYNLYWPNKNVTEQEAKSYMCQLKEGLESVLAYPLRAAGALAYPLPADYVKHPIFSGSDAKMTGVDPRGLEWTRPSDFMISYDDLRECFGAHGPRTLMADSFPDHDLANCSLSQCVDDMSQYASANGWGGVDDIISEKRDEKNDALEQVMQKELKAEDFVNTRQAIGASQMRLQKGTSYLPQQWTNDVCETDCPAFSVIGTRADSGRNLSTAALNSLYTQVGWVADQPASCDSIGWDTSPNTAASGINTGDREYRGAQDYVFKEWSAI